MIIERNLYLNKLIERKHNGLIRENIEATLFNI